MSDLWGADGTQLSTGPWPGDSGSYTEYDAYLTQLVADLKANGMTTNIKLLIWNEPDYGTVFWGPGKPSFEYFLNTSLKVMHSQDSHDTWICGAILLHS